jgi:magnesium chelatase subunit I
MTSSTVPNPRPTTIGELRAAGYPDRTIKEELRENLLARLADGRPLFEGVIGFDASVLPAIERGILAGHDLILLGERGQAKTRIIRHLLGLLDDETPVIAGCEVNDHPYRPICARCRALVASDGTGSRSPGCPGTGDTPRSSPPPTPAWAT